MIPVKRLEIVVDAPHSEQVIAVLESCGLDGWTRVRGAGGAGERGRQLGDEVTGVSSNDLIITTCSAEQLHDVVEELRTLLSRCGGMCLVSDAMWLRH